MSMTMTADNGSPGSHLRNWRHDDDAEELLEQKIRDALRDGVSDRHLAKLIGCPRKRIWQARIYAAIPDGLFDCLIEARPFVGTRALIYIGRYCETGKLPPVECYSPRNRHPQQMDRGREDREKMTGPHTGPHTGPPRTASPFGTGPHCPPYTPTQCGPVDSHAVRMRSAWTALAGGATITEEAARHSHYPFAFSWAARRSLESAATVKNMVLEGLVCGHFCAVLWLLRPRI